MNTKSGDRRRCLRALAALPLLTGALLGQPASGECCPEDLDDNALVDATDLLILLSQWGQTCAPLGDLDHDGIVASGDFLRLLKAWGPCVSAECCREDLDEDQVVGTGDLLIVLNQWGQSGPSLGDVDGDGIVGSMDFLQLLATWGPCPDTKPELMLACWTSPQVRASATSRGWVPIPLMTHRYHYDAEQDSFNAEKYANNIWWPEWTPSWQIPGSVTPEAMCERFGIRNDNDPDLYRGWVDLDFERYGPIRSPEDYEPAEVLRIFNSYLDLAAATRELRPSAKIILHGLYKSYASEAGRVLIEQIAVHYDASSPSIYPQFEEGFGDLEQQLAVFRDRMQFCSDLRETYGLKLIPIVWKRYYPLDHGEINPLSDPPQPYWIVMPEWVGRAVLEVILEYNPDGIIVFGSDGKNHYRLEPNWPPDTPNGDAADATTEAWLGLIEELVGATSGNLQ